MATDPKAKNHRQRIFTAMLLYGPGTYEEIAQISDLRPEQVWSRLAEMYELGMVKPVGHTKTGKHKRWQRVWAAETEYKEEE